LLTDAIFGVELELDGLTAAGAEVAATTPSRVQTAPLATRFSIILTPFSE
jgi:hypothetical protein